MIDLEDLEIEGQTTSFFSFGDTPGERDAKAVGYVVSYEPNGGTLFKSIETCPLLRLYTETGEVKALTASQPNLRRQVEAEHARGNLVEGCVVAVIFDGWRSTSREDTKVRDAQPKTGGTFFKSFTVRIRPKSKVEYGVEGGWFSRNFPAMEEEEVADDQPF